MTTQSPALRGRAWNRHFLYLLVVMIGIAVLLAMPVHGQTALSTVRGTVTDPTGSIVPGVELTLVEVQTKVVARTAVSDHNGNFEMPDLKRGIYRLEATLPGFKTFVADNIELEGSQIRRFDVQLQVGERSDQVTVEAGAAVITTDSAIISYAVTGETYKNNPRSIGYPGTYMGMLPGVQMRGSYTDTVFYGQFQQQVTDTMDGVGKDGTVTLLDQMMMLDEIKVSAVGARADQARVATFNMTSPAGTGKLHGRFIYRQSNSALNARSYFSPTKPVSKNHVWLLEFSGPIFKEKTFFFASYYLQLLPGGSDYLANVPSLQMRQGNFSQISSKIVDPSTGQPFLNNTIPSSRINPTSQKVLDSFIPPPNLGAPGSLTNNLVFSHAWPSDVYDVRYPLVRIDHNFTKNNTLTGRYIHRDTPYVLASGLPNMTWTRERMHRAVVVTDTHVFSPALVQTARFGWLSDRVEDGTTVDGVTPRTGDKIVEQIGLQGVNLAGKSVQGSPRIDITGFTSLYTTPGGLVENQRRYTYSYAMTWAKGRHVLKFGGDFYRYREFSGQVPEANWGVFAFNGRFTGNAVADFLLGIPNSSQRLNPLLDRYRIAQELGIYAMDTFKVSGKLTLDFGLRWDYFPANYYVDGLQFNWDPATGNVIVPTDALSSVSPLYPKNINITTGEVLPKPGRRNFAPRFGFAYRLKGDTVIRGGYGLFTEKIPDFGRLQGGGPFQISETYINQITNGIPFIAFPKPFPSTLEAALANVPSQSVTGYPNDTNNGAIHQFNLSVERQWHNLGFRMSYVGSRSRGMNYSLNLNKPAPSLIPFSTARRPFPQFVGTTVFRSNGASNYNCVEFQVQRKVGAFTFSAHYDIQSNMSNFLNLQDPYDPNRWQTESSPTRNTVVVNASIKLPWGSGRRFLSNAGSFLNLVIGGWELNTMSEFRSGQYFTPSFSGSDPSNTNTFGGVPDRIADGNLPSDQRSINQWFDTAAFIVPPKGRFGNSGINILEGPGQQVHHLSVNKRFPLGDRFNLDFFSRMTNLFNHPSFAIPRTDIVAANPGRITGTSGSAAGARSIQLELRLLW